jgi:hypothetical protein
MFWSSGKGQVLLTKVLLLPIQRKTMVPKKSCHLNKQDKKWSLLFKGVLYSIYIVNTEMCECGEAKETINHIPWQCKLLKKFRVHMIDDLMKCNIFPPYCIKAILHCMLPEAVIPVA